MKLKTIIGIVLILIAAIIIAFMYVPNLINRADANNMSVNNLSLRPLEESEFINLPNGFHIAEFSEIEEGPRLMEAIGNKIYIAAIKSGEIFVLEDRNNDFKIDDSEKIVFLSGLDKPHSIAFHEDWIYISSEGEVIRVKDLNNDNRGDVGTIERVIELPQGGNHFTRTIDIFDNALYITIGSTCNACNEEDGRRAAMLRCGLDGKNCTTFASGLRNTVDFVFHDGKIYGTDNGLDSLGNDIPPDEINLIEEGKNYGWPICFGKQIHDTNFDKNTYIRDPCIDTEPSFLDLQAHSAPLGLAFYEGDEFPFEYRGDLFIAYHGSWNRNPPTGYKIVRVDWDTKKVSDFATGWLDGSRVLGRPVGIVNYKNGLLISDDNKNKIYWIWHE